MAIAGGSQLLGGLALLPFLFIAPPPPAAFTPSVACCCRLRAPVQRDCLYHLLRLIADIGPTRALTVTFLIPVFAMGWASSS